MHRPRVGIRWSAILLCLFTLPPLISVKSEPPLCSAQQPLDGMTVALNASFLPAMGGALVQVGRADDPSIFIRARVVDLCVHCRFSDIELSLAAFAHLATLQEIAVEWYSPWSSVHL